MTDKKTEALKLAQEAIDDRASLTRWKKARDAIREALAEQPAPGSHLTDEQKAVNGLAWLARLEALREEWAGLAEQPAQQQEPVAWWHQKSDTFTSGSLVSNFVEWTPLYTSPPAQQQEPVARCMEHGECFGGECIYTSPPAQRTWVGLTEEDRLDIWKKSSSIDGAINATASKLREKNT